MNYYCHTYNELYSNISRYCYDNDIYQEINIEYITLQDILLKYSYNFISYVINNLLYYIKLCYQLDFSSSYFYEIYIINVSFVLNCNMSYIRSYFIINVDTTKIMNITNIIKQYIHVIIKIVTIRLNICIMFIYEYCKKLIKNEVKYQINKYVKTELDFSKITMKDLFIILIIHTKKYILYFLFQLIMGLIVCYTIPKLYHLIMYLHNFIYRIRTLEIKFKQ